jgi:hypothetical protein
LILYLTPSLANVMVNEINPAEIEKLVSKGSLLFVSAEIRVYLYMPHNSLDPGFHKVQQQNWC